MAIKIGPAWLNMSVKNVGATKKFYQAIGFKLNGRPKHDLVSFLVGANEMVVHFFQQESFEASTKGLAVDAKKANEIMITLGSTSKQQINAITKKVKAAGGKVFSEPAPFGDGYYGCAFADPDGHKWNLLLIE